MTLSLALTLCKVFIVGGDSPPTSFILTEAVAGDTILLELAAVSKLGLEQP
jgi:hypothetical protein